MSVTFPSSVLGFAKCDAFSNFCISWTLLLNPILLVSIVGLADGVDMPGAEERCPYWDIFCTLNIVSLIVRVFEMQRFRIWFFYHLQTKEKTNLIGSTERDNLTE